MTPKYQKVANELKKQIPVLLREGARKLPGEIELAAMFDCSRQTVRTALASLAAEGVITKRHGSGSYITETTSSRSREIALLVPDRNEYIYPHIIQDIKHTLSAKGYTVTCYDTDGRFLTERKILTKLIEDPPAGIIMEAINNIIPCMNQAQLRQIDEAGIPLIYLHNAYSFPIGAVCIGQDNFGGGYELVKYLYSKGHRNIAGIMRSDVKSGIERYSGCVQASLDLGLDFQESGYFWYAAESRKRLLENDDTALKYYIQGLLISNTAIICYNDEIAYRLIRVMQMNNISVPGTMAIASFDNSYYCTSGDIGITSLGHAPNNIGKCAADAMLSLIAGKRTQSCYLPWSLNERASS